MTLDWDGKIRMDCSSPSAMASLIARQHEFDIATGNDTDSDRHGIVTPDGGLMNPNHYLAVAIDYLYAHRPNWPAERGGRQDAGQLVDDRPGRGRARPHAARGAGRVQVVRARPARRLGRVRWRGERGRVVPAARRRRCGRPTRTASSCACSRRRSPPSPGRSPSEHYRELTEQFGDPAYARIDSPATREAEGRTRKARPVRGARGHARRRPDHRPAHQGARQRRGRSAA